MKRAGGSRWQGTVFACLLAAGLAAATLGPLTGCDRDADVCGPEVPAGRLLGHVRTGGLAVTATIAAYRVVDGVPSANAFETRSDTTGYYALDLPAGRYVVEVRLPDSYYWSAGALYGTRSGVVSAVPDTLAIDGSVFATTLNFDLAGLEFDLALSHAIDGEQGQIVLHRRPDELVAGAEVTAKVSGTITDGRLRLRVPGLPPGAYQIEVVLGYRDYLCFCPYDGEHLWLPGTRDRAASPWTTFAADELVTLTGQIAAEPAWLSGHVGGAARAMGLLDAADIALVTPDSVTVVGERRAVRGDGSFAIPLHLAGPVKLAVIQNGMAYWAGGPDFAAATTFDLNPGQSVTDVEVTSSGLLVDVEGPSANLQNAAFEFHDAASGALVRTATVGIGTQRRFGLANLGPGRYVVRVRHEHGYVDGMISGLDAWPLWRPQWFDRVATAADAQVLEVGVGQVVPLQLRLEMGGAISGRVAAGTGADSTFCYVFATPADQLQTLDRVFVSSAPDRREFAITGLADGAYKLGACAGALIQDEFGPPPAGTVWYPATDDWAAAATFTITDAATLADVVLPPP
jgi:hypothetical protein